MTTTRLRSRSRGFTLIEIMIVVVIIGVISAGVLLSVNLTGRDRDLEKESDRLLTLVNYVREQAEMQTRDYGIVVHADGYQFVAYDARRAVWREVYEDDALHIRKLPDGLDFKLVVDARPVVLLSTGEVKAADPKDLAKKKKTLDDLKNVTDAASLKDAMGGHKMDDDDSSKLAQAKKIKPQVLIYANGDLSSFEITVEREGGVRSVTLAQDDKGVVIAKPMVETPNLKSRGFTLIEVLVALVIVAVGMGVLMSTLTSSARTVVYLQDKTFAEWAALNQITLLRLQLQQGNLPPQKTTNGDFDYAGRTWHWRQDVVASSVPGLERIDFKVRPKEVKGGDDDSWYVTVSGVMGSAIGTPGLAFSQYSWDGGQNGQPGSGGNQGTSLNPTNPGNNPTQTPPTNPLRGGGTK